MRGYALKIVFSLFAALGLSAQEQGRNEAELWDDAVSYRAESFTMAPETLPYEQYQLERSGAVAHRETGRMRLTYDAEGKAAVTIIWAQRDNANFTEERARRLARQASRRNDFLSLTTPFDPDIQYKLKRQPGQRVYAGGTVLWQYDFELPMEGNRSLVGTARVREDTGKPYDVRYSARPLPWFIDLIEIHVRFDSDSPLLLFQDVDYRYEASFLFMVWRGGGRAAFEDWRKISAPPRLN
jgi:hypothetical protein